MAVNEAQEAFSINFEVRIVYDMYINNSQIKIQYIKILIFKI